MSLTDLLGASQQAKGRATRGRTPIYRLALKGEEPDVTVQDATFMMGEDIHDTVSMSVTSSTLTTTDGILESPITFLYGLAPRTETFCGYVTAVTEDNSSSQGVLSWKMEVIGPTKQMQSGVPRFWTSRTIPSAVESLSYYSYLGYTGHAQDHIWPTLAQTDDTDWKTAVSLARRIGWSVFNRYGVVMLYDPLLLFKGQGSAFTLISETYTLAKTEIDGERMLLEFQPMEEAESALPQQGYKVAYFHEGSLQVALQKGDHSNYRFITDIVIRDTDEASLYVNSKDSDCSLWNQQATARIMGNAAIFPGMSVDILTTSPKFYKGKYNGRWLVRAVQHKMDRQDFQTNLVLARPDSKTQVYSGGYTPFWQSLTMTRPRLSLSQTMSLLVPVGTVGDLPVPQLSVTPTPDAGVWVSTWTNPTVRSVA